MIKEFKAPVKWYYEWLTAPTIFLAGSIEQDKAVSNSTSKYFGRIN